jgi:hypothetical protein
MAVVVVSSGANPAEVCLEGVVDGAAAADDEEATAAATADLVVAELVLARFKR